MPLASPSLLLAAALLRPAFASDAEIVVEDERTTSDPGTSATVIELDGSMPAATDLAGVVDSASGTTIARLGGLGDYSAVSIRGSTFSQVVVCLDGVPLNPDGASAINLSELPLSSFSRVEVYRSHVPSRFGVAPIGGVVNLVTGDTPVGPAIGGAVGSYQTGRVNARLGAELGQGDLLATVSTLTTQGDFEYFADNGTDVNLRDDSVRTRGNNDKAQLALHARLRQSLGAWDLSLLDAYLQRDEGLPGHSNLAVPSTRLSTQRNLAVAVMERPGPTPLALRAWHLGRRELYDDALSELGLASQLSDDRTDTLGAMAHVQASPRDWLIPSATLALRRERHVSTSLQTGKTGPAFVRRGLTAATELDVYLWQDRLTLSPALSALLLDNQAAVDVQTRALNPRITGVLNPVEGLQLHGAIGRTTRAPSFMELYGDRGAVIGNPELRPERALAWDAGGRIESPWEGPVEGVLDLAYFWSWTEDRIVYIQNSQRTALPVNLEETWTHGVELALSLDVGPLSSQSNATWNGSVNLSGNAAYQDKQLPRIPTWELSQITSAAVQDRLRVGHTWSYTDGNYWDRTNFYRAAPRSLHGVFARVKPLERGPSIELDVLNLSNRIVQVVPANPLDPSDDSRVVQPITDFIGYPLPGRTLMVSLEWGAT